MNKTLPAENPYFANLQWLRRHIDEALARFKNAHNKHGYYLARSNKVDAAKQVARIWLEMRPREDDGDPICSAKFAVFRNRAMTIELTHCGYADDMPLISLDDEQQATSEIVRAIHSMMLASAIQ